MKITVREAISKDLPFVATLYQEGVRGGHFWAQPNLQIERMLDDWYAKGAITRHAIREDGIPRIEALPIKFLIAEQDTEPAGFLIAAPEEPENKNSTEIYLMSVAKEKRRSGIATKLIQHAENHQLQGHTFYARCYPKSTWAIELLKKLGYRVVSISPDSKVHYLRKP